MLLKARYLETASRGYATLQPEAFATEPDRDMCCLSFACACGKLGRIIVRRAALPAQEDARCEVCFCPTTREYRTGEKIQNFQLDNDEIFLKKHV